jgi:hypothetical protein
MDCVHSFITLLSYPPPFFFSSPALEFVVLLHTHTPSHPCAIELALYNDARFLAQIACFFVR